MKIEKGKHYCTRSGQKVEVLTTERKSREFPIVGLVGKDQVVSVFTANGEWSDASFEHPLDIIAPWIDKPTITRLPLTAEDIPDTCWLHLPGNDGDILVTAVYRDCVHAGHGRVQPYAEMLAWMYSENRIDWKPCYKIVEQ